MSFAWETTESYRIPAGDYALFIEQPGWALLGKDPRKKQWHWCVVRISEREGYGSMVAAVRLCRGCLDGYGPGAVYWHGLFREPNDDFGEKPVCEKCRLIAKEG